MKPLFVSFYAKKRTTDTDFSFGYISIESYGELKTIKDVDELASSIADTAGCEEIAIISWRRME